MSIQTGRTLLKHLTCALNNNIRPSTIVLTQKRNSSYRSSPFVCDLLEPNRKYDITQIPEDWKYVERALPPTLVPEFKPKESYSSGWKPQGDVKSKPYCVQRTKNRMIPVYLEVSRLGIRRMTNVRKIQGDIWLLHKELLQFLQKQQVRPVRSQVNELSATICFYGDHVNAIKYWLMQRDF